MSKRFISESLKKRLLSFVWRLGNVMAISGLNFVIDNLSEFGLPLWVAGIIGLATAELTKYLNTKKSK